MCCVDEQGSDHNVGSDAHVALVEFAAYVTVVDVVECGKNVQEYVSSANAL